MKMFILYILMPMQIFCCQDCIERIQEKLGNVSFQIMYAESSNISPYDVYFLFGQFDAYCIALHILEKSHDQ